MIITFNDYLFAFLYFLLLLLLVIIVRNKTIHNPAIKKYFIPAFVVKVVGAMGIGMVYQYFYGFGDTFGYYNMGKFFLQAYNDGQASFREIFFTGDNEFYGNLGYQYNFSSWYAFNPQTIIVARFSALFSLLGGGYYFTTALFFALFSFAGIWQLFRTFFSLFPTLHKPLAWFILFLPSVFFWGSGLLKDSLSMTGLGFLTFNCFQLFIRRKKIGQSLLLIGLSAYLVFLVKAYILFSFVPAVLMWVLFEYRKRIRNRAIKRLLLPVILILLVIGFGFLNNRLSLVYENLALENVTKTALSVQQNIGAYESGSSYSIGQSDGSLFGFLKMLFPALIVTLFRPFPWEISNIFSFISTLESMFFIWFTIRTFRKAGVKQFFNMVANKPIVLFCFTFAIIFAIAVGIASQNFGTLVRYKIPCMPFYLVGVLLVNYYATGETNPLTKKNQPRYRKIITRLPT
ncbi:MAG TPA: hypothetical protein VJU78_09875 [Chitinophagaceae bacterium]|nr:hypothetical protein [Chitinophagaceae bacterium]